MCRSKDFTDSVDAYYINTMLDDFESELAEGQHRDLLKHFINIRHEFETYVDDAMELAEALNDIHDIVEG